MSGTTVNSSFTYTYNALGELTSATDNANRPLDPNSPAPPKAEDPGGYGAVWVDPATSIPYCALLAAGS